MFFFFYMVSYLGLMDVVIRGKVSLGCLVIVDGLKCILGYLFEVGG